MWASGNGEKERLLTDLVSIQVQRMRMRPLLPRNLGAAERVSLPWDDPGGCVDISSVEAYQFSEDYQVLRFHTISFLRTIKDSVPQATLGEYLWKYQSFGGGCIRRVLIAQEIGDFRMLFVPLRVVEGPGHNCNGMVWGINS